MRNGDGKLGPAALEDVDGELPAIGLELQPQGSRRRFARRLQRPEQCGESPARLGRHRKPPQFGVAGARQPGEQGVAGAGAQHLLRGP